MSSHLRMSVWIHYQMKWIHQQEGALYFQAGFNIFTAAVGDSMCCRKTDFIITRKVFEYWQNDPERIGRNHTYYPDRANKTDWITTNYRGEQQATSMLVTVFVDEIWFWKFWGAPIRCIDKVTKIMILSPISENCHHDQVINIPLSPT